MKTIWILAVSFLVVLPSWVKAEEGPGAIQPKQWSLDVTGSVSPFDNFDLGYGANVVYYFTDKLGVGLTGQFKFDSVTNSGTNAEILEAEVGARLKYFVSGSNTTSGVVLSPSIILIDWMDRNVVAISKRMGMRIGLDASYEEALTDKVFFGVGAGIGFYPMKPGISFSSTTMDWNSSLLLQGFAQLGVRL